MDIKLNARLSAYSNVAAFVPSDYSPPVVTHEEIDQLFKTNASAQAVTKSEIDTLFDETEDFSKLELSETEPSEITNVSKAQIDSLFR